MPVLHLALLLAAFILFILAAVGMPSGKVNLTASGLACWVLSLIIP